VAVQPVQAPVQAQSVESPRIDPAPFNVVRMTPPVEATLRILLNSVPYLIGAAVVRQPAVGDALEAEVGRMPWLHDRRLLTLQLPDDSLPANRAILLDWPVPYKAEWVGAPPRLLISRLVAQGRTVGVLLGTLISREQISAPAREALDLSCELIAAAVGSDSLATVATTPTAEEPRRLVVVPNEPEPEPESSLVMAVPAESEPVLDPKAEQDERDRQVVDEVARALDELTDAKSIGRVLRDAVTAIAGVDGFSLALFNSVRREVAYRYKVVGADPDSAEMGRQAVDDGPDCYAARHDRRWHGFVREIGVRGPEGVEARKISVLQFPLLAADEVFGVATLQVFGDSGFSDHATRLVLRVIEVSSDRLAAVRRAARFQPSLSPPESAAAAVLPPVAAAPFPAPVASGSEAPTTDQILNDLVNNCTEIGLPTTFMVGVDPAAGLLRGELISSSSAARELDYALGISAGRFTIELSDRYNAIARACREGRIVTSPTLDELVHPLRDADGAATLERLVQGGRSTIIPITVSGDVVGALVVGPMADEPGFSTIVKARDLVNETASRLTEAWRTKH
jgi:hypothetical protein